MSQICKNWRIFQQFWKIFSKINIKFIKIQMFGRGKAPSNPQKWQSRQRLAAKQLVSNITKYVANSRCPERCNFKMSGTYVFWISIYPLHRSGLINSAQACLGDILDMCFTSKSVTSHFHQFKTNIDSFKGPQLPLLRCELN